LRAARTANEQAPPLLPVARPCLDDGSVDLGVGFCCIVRDFFAFLLDLGDSGLLLNDRCLQILEHFGQDDQIPFEFLDGVVSASDGS